MLSLLLVAAAPSLSPNDWPQAFGPNRDGVSAETDWESAGASEPLWRTNVGLGYSCPSLVGARLVTMGYDPEAGEDRVLCLDAHTGEERWSHAYEATDDPSYHGGGTLSTPTIAGGVVYTTNRHGRAFALDLESGAVLWERDHATELGLEETFHGFSASPIVMEDRIVHVFGGVAAAVEREGGGLLWRTEDYGGASAANATPFELRGRSCIAAVLGTTFVVLDTQDGGILHEHDWALRGNAMHCAQPLVIGDRVLVSTAYAKGAELLRLGEERAPQVMWSSRRLRNKVTGVYHHDRHLYGFDESMLKCFDLDGNERWRVRGLGMGSLSIAGDRLLVLSSSGEFIVAEASPEEFRELSRRDALEGGSYWTMPVLVDGLVYLRNSLGDLVCLDHRSASGASGGADAGAESVALTAPAAAELFAAHAEVAGADVLRGAEGLRLEGGWEILGRGMSLEGARFVLGAPDRWHVSLADGPLEYMFDGEVAWEQKNGGHRLLDGPEAEEAPRFLSIAELFAPLCPEGAVVASAPVQFAGVRCWRVDSSESLDGEDGVRRTAHFFAVDDGRLVGRDGDALSAAHFSGELELEGARLPAKVVLYRHGSGQEETFVFERGAWFEPDEATFARPEAIRRLLRTPAELAADEAVLRERYAAALGRYDASAFEPELVFEVAVGRGELLVRDSEDDFVLRPVEGEVDTFRFGSLGADLRFEREGEAVAALVATFGPEEVRLPRID